MQCITGNSCGPTTSSRRGRITSLMPSVALPDDSELEGEGERIGGREREGVKEDIPNMRPTDRFNAL